MADTATGVHPGHGAANGAESTTAPPNHLGTNVPSGQFDEKKEYNGAPAVTDEKPAAAPAKDVVDEDEEEDEDIDALIEELESQDAGIDVEEEETTQPGGARPISEDLLQTDPSHGLTSADVLARRKKFGMNQMKEEKENLILKFLMYFVGPIQFVMEVGLPIRKCAVRWLTQTRLPPFLPPVFKIGLTLVSSVLFSCSTPPLVLSRNSRPVLSSTNSRRRSLSVLLLFVMVTSLRLPRLRLSLVISSRSKM